MIDNIEVRSDKESLKIYGKDWTKHFVPNPSQVFFPKSTDEVKALVDWARQSKIALVPSGGRTGLSAAAYATNGEAIISLEKMNKIIELDPIDQTLHCQAGVITEKIQKFAEENGFYYPVDFAARGSSQIGGNVATNAGGIKVIRYGLTRNWVAGLTVVTGRGEILKLNKSLVKNATGYDLRHLFIGSEGTLGIVTEVTLNLTRSPKSLSVYVVGTDSLNSIMNIYSAFKKQFSLVAYEMFTDLALKYVLAMGHGQPPLSTSPKYYILVELENESEVQNDKVMEVISDLIDKGDATDATMAQNPKQATEFWSFRENITESTSHKMPYKNDVSVRVSKVAEFLDEMTKLISKEHPDFEVVWFGHVGDGNLHINILKPDSISSEEFVKRCKSVDKLMFTLIERLEGSISAEHGVGLVKKPFLLHTRSREEVQLMREIKKVFDPDNILNPGKIFDI